MKYYVLKIWILLKSSVSAGLLWHQARGESGTLRLDCQVEVKAQAPHVTHFDKGGNWGEVGRDASLLLGRVGFSASPLGPCRYQPGWEGEGHLLRVPHESSNGGEARFNIYPPLTSAGRGRGTSVPLRVDGSLESPHGLQWHLCRESGKALCHWVTVKVPPHHSVFFDSTLVCLWRWGRTPHRSRLYFGFIVSASIGISNLQISPAPRLEYMRQKENPENSATFFLRSQDPNRSVFFSTSFRLILCSFCMYCPGILAVFSGKCRETWETLS